MSRYKHMDLIDLEHKIMEAEDAGGRVKLIATDGVFSMDGDVSAATRAAGNRVGEVTSRPFAILDGMHHTG
jgi:formylmethanofuran dehydrogenase subunit A